VRSERAHRSNLAAWQRLGFRFRARPGATIVAADEFLRTMKPAAAFSIGLWTGAAVVAAVGLFYVQSAGRPRGGASSAADSKLAEEAEQIHSLEQENARLNAELQRFKETASILKSNLAEQTAAASSSRRVPFIFQPTGTGSSVAEEAPDSWVEQAVAGADATTLPRLEQLALKNNRRALEALALLAGLDQGATLTRVWRSGLLTLPRFVDATRYLAATMEVNPDAEQLLRGLAADPNTEPRTLYAVVEGLANPEVSTNAGSAGAATTASHFKTDYAGRIRLLDGLRSSFTNDDLRRYVDQAEAELQTRWAESNPPTP